MDMIHVKTAIHNRMNRIEITDLTLPELQVYTSLNEAQLLHYYEPAPGIFIAESPKVIERALEFGCEPISLLMEQKDFDTCGKNIIAQCKNIPVYTAKLEVLEQITGYKLARGMLCAMHRPAMPSAEEICKKCKAHRSAGKCCKSNKCRSGFPVSGGIKHGCGAVDVCVQ